MRAASNRRVTAKVHFGLTQCTLEVDVSEGLHALSGATLKDILVADGAIQDSDVGNRLIKAVKGNKQLQASYAEYASEYADLNSRLLEHRGYGLDGDEEPEVTLKVDELLAWTQRFKPRAVPKA